VADAQIAVIGDALIDELNTQTGIHEFVGGAALNVAVGLSVLGVETALVAMVGDDRDGASIRNFLDEHGVLLVASPSVAGSARATSDRRAGEPFYAFNAAAQARTIDFDAGAHTAINAAQNVVISSFPFDDRAQFEALRTTVERPENRLILDPNPRSGLLHDAQLFAQNFEVLAASSLLTKVSDEDAELLGYASLHALTDRLIDLGTAHVLTTAGAAGASIVTREGLRVSVPICDVPGPIVDTMGAGDATLATIASQITAHGIPTDREAWAEVLGEAMLVAAATCRTNGALIQLPDTWDRQTAR
jgi:fructokinase